MRPREGLSSKGNVSGDIRTVEDSSWLAAESVQFIQVPVTATVGLMIAMINGLLRQRSLQLEAVRNMKKTTIDFCRRSLVKNY